MLRLPPLLATLLLVVPAGAQEEEAEKIRDEKSGLVVVMPEKWSRDSAREKGGVKFAGLYDITSSKYVLFVVETGPSTGFDEAAWLGREKAAAAKNLKSTDTPWTTEPIMIGGARAVRYTIGGKANGEKEFELRIRSCGLVRNDVFFKISEHSYNRAHDEAADALKAMWEAVRFEEANPFAEEEKEEGRGEEETPKEEGGGQEGGGLNAEPTVIEDKAGNFKVTMPASWSLDRMPAEDEGTGTRVYMHREEGGREVAWVEIARIRMLRADFFESHEAGDAVEKLVNEELKLFERYFDAESAKVIRPRIDARARLGGADKTCGYEVRGLRLSEQAQITDAQTLINRGDTSVKLPEFPEMVVRGRLAMVSPHVYVTFVQTARGMAANETLEAEIAKIQDSFELLSTEGMPPALESDQGPFGNTLADPKNAAERKMSKDHEYKKGLKVAATLKLDYALPPGFQEVPAVRDDAGSGVFGGADVPLQVVAQDGNNGWVWIRVIAISQKSLPPRTKFEEKQKTFETWISNFESRARGTGRLPKKPEDVKVGNLSGDGCQMEGKINKFSATELNLVTMEGGWWIKFELRTRGSGSRTFADGIKTFVKKFRATKK